MVAIAKYQDGTYEVKNDIGLNITMLCKNGRWYYDKESFDFDIETFPPTPKETVIYKGNPK
jgi:hypothetical protein